MIFVLDVEVEHGEVDDETENTDKGFEFSETLEAEDQEGQQHLLLVDVETVQEERHRGEE
jgi:hypothetical protein